MLAQQAWAVAQFVPVLVEASLGQVAGTQAAVD
jgi:hypothetical protein